MDRLAAAVVSLLALGGCDSDGPPAVEGPTLPALDVTGTEMHFDPAELAVAAGDVRVVLHNAGVVRHDLRIEGKPSLLLEAAPGETATATWRLPTGRYRIYCSLPGHRAAGMEGILEVRKSGSPG
jgi:uncharacterized cupredoxin-like copper-binding protein